MENNTDMNKLNQEQEELLNFLKELLCCDFKELVRMNEGKEKEEYISCYSESMNDFIKKYSYEPPRDLIFSFNEPSYITLLITFRRLIMDKLKYEAFTEMSFSLLRRYVDLMNTLPPLTYNFEDAKNLLIIEYFINTLDHFEEGYYLTKFKIVFLEDLMSEETPVFSPISSDDYKKIFVKGFEDLIPGVLRSKAYVQCLKLFFINQEQRDELFAHHVSDTALSNNLEQIITALPTTLIKTYLQGKYGLTVGNKFIYLNNEKFFIANANSKFNLSSGFLVTLIHELTHYYIRRFIKSTNIQEESPRLIRNKTEYDSGDLFEESLFGEKLKLLNDDQSAYLLKIENWNKSVNDFSTNFKKIPSGDKRTNGRRMRVIDLSRMDGDLKCGVQGIRKKHMINKEINKAEIADKVCAQVKRVKKLKVKVVEGKETNYLLSHKRYKLN
jgi:hypothetical protein